MKRLFFAVLVAYAATFVMVAQEREFWKGADISWITELEQQGAQFYDFNGDRQDPFKLMKQLGIDAIRLRVWVDPKKHKNWCNAQDVLRKAQRAQAEEMEVMLDFHYSDWWADPGKQNIPKRWKKCSYEQMCDSVHAHTRDILMYLAENGVKPRWVQVGNETSNGLLFDVKVNRKGWVVPGKDGNSIVRRSVGRADRNPEQYAGLLKAGCLAVEEVLPEAIRIIHLDNGWNPKLYEWNLGILEEYGVPYDMIGMSLYPYWSMLDGSEPSAEQTIRDCVKNMHFCRERFNKPVMIVETGYAVDEAHPEVMETGREQLSRLLHEAYDMRNVCKGVFYWEPMCKPSVYKLGAFTEDGHPTEIMKAFGDW